MDIGGRALEVAVERAAGGFDVTLDGRRYVADLVAVPSGWSLLLDGRSYDVAVEAAGGALMVHIGGRAIPVTDASAADGRGGGRRRAAAHAGGAPTIVAPMPGRIVRILVQAGDVVSARQGLIVIEAMKMENELRAPGPGTVTEVRIAEGDSVEAGSVLIVIA